MLRRYGPNHAAEPIVTRWRRKGKAILKDSFEHPILEMLLVKRTADQSWSIPGRIIDSASKNLIAPSTVRKDFVNKSIFSKSLSKTDKAELQRKLNHLYGHSVEISADIVKDDPRNTDNAWVEATVAHYHDESGEATRTCVLPPQAQPLASLL